MPSAETEPSQKPVVRPPSLRIAIQGYPGAFHEIAARQYLHPQSLDIVAAHTFEDLIALVEAGEQADAGLMAVENTLAGTILSNYRLLQASQLRAVGEVYLRIRQNLLVLPGAQLQELREVHSHPVAIAQCLTFFEKYPHIKLIENADTALSARMVAESGRTDIGAIGSELAASLYGLIVLSPAIETNKHNFTRFLVLQRQEAKSLPVAPQIPDKVSLSFAVDHQVGSLYKVLAVLAAYNLNLTKIQSSPIIGRPWEYSFFIDFIADGKVSYAQAIEAIQPITRELKIIGIYPQGQRE